ncbi:hypothetical protein EDD52_12117 [Primorskyibacter sedentarius]|uniref:Uncharacterized protein n=1 Tax=Primorskyibacter sedentarius TaxID=745311 RepID=A0A4V2UMV4_9RHOB|nr:hypothetical protein EDD52_12117 [Primorskyibacter sedentarius]
MAAQNMFVKSAMDWKRICAEQYSAPCQRCDMISRHLQIGWSLATFSLSFEVGVPERSARSSS